MPDVTVKLRPGYLDTKSDFQKDGFVRDLKGLVARALDTGTPEGYLCDDDIDVVFTTFGVYEKGQLGIRIVANKYPERVANLDERRQKIECGLRIQPLVSLLKSSEKGSRYIWIQLVDGSYGEF